MSVGAASTSQVAVLGARGRIGLARDTASAYRPVVRLLTFGALALYGTLKWSTLITGGRTVPRLLALLAVALLLAAGRPLLARQSRLLAAGATVVALVAVFPLAGVPLEWVVHLRIAVAANAIGEGLSALPQALVPYSGVDPYVTMVIVLGGAVLLFDAALLVAFAPPAMEDLRRVGAALPLVALAAVPTTLVHPSLPYVDGAVLFVLLVAFVWGERIGSRQGGGAFVLCGLAAVAAMFAAPAVDRHQPWVDYRALAGELSPTTVAAFDWSQGYGRVDWPQKGQVVLEIQASHPEYWKAENLDAFNGVGWGQATGSSAATTTPQPDSAALRRWTQTIEVTDQDMRGPEVIGAGVSKAPADLSQVAPGQSPGTWTTGSELAPGDSYSINVYAPDPTRAELRSAGIDYTGVAAQYLTLELPQSHLGAGPSSQIIPGEVVGGDQPQLVFSRFHSDQRVQSVGGPVGVSGAALLKISDDTGSRYGDAYRLARRLAAGAATPFDFALAVETYLRHGFIYDESPPPSAYPLTAFLFSTRAGYCQQFAGAMALLLRMGGVPARVAVGFTPGRLDAATHRWRVTDFDAHAWVEAWFPHYGWVQFDPTPPADPALGGHTPIPSTAISSSGATPLGSAAETHGGARTAAERHGVVSSHAHAGGGGPGIELAAIAALAVLVLALLATKPLRSVEALVAELEGALRRMGRPLPTGATLAGLERRVSGSPDATAYVRALRLARFGGGHDWPTPSQRRALRRELRLGRGLFGALRALWALPPRWHPRGTPAERGPGA